MRYRLKAAACLLGILAGAAPLGAQQPADPLGNAVVRLTVRLDSLERGSCPTGPAVAVT